MANDYRRLRHESLRNTSNRETPFTKVLLPKLCEHFANIKSFKFNGSSLAAYINYTKMMIVSQPFQLLPGFRQSNNKPPVRCKAQRINCTRLTPYPSGCCWKIN